jgi:hypothetical protein
MAAKGYINILLGLVILLAPMVFHGIRCGLFNGFAWNKLWRTVDRSILFQGGLAILTIYPLLLAGFSGMSGHVLHPALNVLAMAFFHFQYLFWAYYAPAVVIVKLIRMVADRMKKRREKVA